MWSPKRTSFSFLFLPLAKSWCHKDLWCSSRQVVLLWCYLLARNMEKATKTRLPTSVDFDSSGKLRPRQCISCFLLSNLALEFSMHGVNWVQMSRCQKYFSHENRWWKKIGISRPNSSYILGNPWQLPSRVKGQDHQKRSFHKCNAKKTRKLSQLKPMPTTKTHKNLEPLCFPNLEHFRDFFSLFISRQINELSLSNALFWWFITCYSTSLKHVL